ncbi:hypothetical protein T4B_660 [Trichinella pseudospiralis]|uniref:Uncharacterized protein n=1 Tax=Trichinella pseudospiralis TaxID=6337 RepID=A0A0V1JJD1_TRIPS|nr:hypothetical protein T4B_660 [Trichinella pseudospiralis]KRZ43968.1 hypothetical protein T4C_10471 [Trichinella pseudospiralis]
MTKLPIKRLADFKNPSQTASSNKDNPALRIWLNWWKIGTSLESEIIKQTHISLDHRYPLCDIFLKFYLQSTKQYQQCHNSYSI